MKKILVIGATGDIGRYVVDWLNTRKKDCDELIAIGRKETECFAKYNIEYISIDITKKETLSQLPEEDVYAVILLAGMMPARMEKYTPFEYINTNIIGIFHVLEYCRHVKANRVIFLQTIRDVGNYIGYDDPIEADCARSFSYKGDHAMYVISKNTAVDCIEHYYQEYGLKRFILRIPTVYMYSQNKYYYVDGIKKMLAYRYLIEQARSGNPIEMWGDPQRAHDILYVKDLCYLIECTLYANCDGGIYNAGTGSPVTLEDQIKGIIEVFSPPEKKSIVVLKPEKPNARSYTMDISKTKKELGYEPKYDYIAYLEDFKEEMKKQRFAY